MSESSPLPADVRWRFTREQLLKLIHHIHPIPLGRGFHEKYVASNWPGLTFQRAMEFGGRARVWTTNRGHFSGLGVSKRVKELHVLRDGSTRVVGYTRAERAARDAAPKQKGGSGGFLMRVDPAIFDDDGGVDRLAEEIFRRLGGGDE